MTSGRIEELQKQTAYPDSQSVQQAMLQVWNEVQQDFNSRTCENCKYIIEESVITVMKCTYKHNDIIFPYKDFGCNKWKSK